MRNTIKSKVSYLYKSILFLFVLFAIPALAQVEQSTPSGQLYSFTLKQAVDYALQHQAIVANAKLGETISSEKIRESLSSYLPQVNGNAELDDYIAKPVSILPSQFAAFIPPGESLAVSFILQYQATAGLSASQMIYNGADLATIKAASTYKDVSKESTKTSEIEVVAAVSKSYYAVKIAEENLMAFDSTIVATQKNLNDTKAMYKQGFVEKLDVDRIKVTLSNQQVERQNLRSSIDLAYYALKYAMGMPVNATLNLAEKIPDSFPPPVTETSDYNKRIEFQLAQTTSALDNYSLKIDKAGYLPTLSAFGSISANAYRSDFSIFDTREHWYPTGIIGLKLAVPIFDGFQKDARIKEASLTLAQQQNTINDLKNKIDLDVKQSSVTYESNYKNWESQKESLKLAEDNARITKIKYEQGVGSNSDVIQTEDALVQSQTSYYNALINIAIAYIDLQKAKGTLY